MQCKLCSQKHTQSNCFKRAKCSALSQEDSEYRVYPGQMGQVWDGITRGSCWLRGLRNILGLWDDSPHSPQGSGRDTLMD